MIEFYCGLAIGLILLAIFLYCVSARKKRKNKELNEFLGKTREQINNVMLENDNLKNELAKREEQIEAAATSEAIKQILTPIKQEEVSKDVNTGSVTGELAVSGDSLAICDNSDDLGKN